MQQLMEPPARAPVNYPGLREHTQAKPVAPPAKQAPKKSAPPPAESITLPPASGVGHGKRRKMI